MMEPYQKDQAAEDNQKRILILEGRIAELNAQLSNQDIETESILYSISHDFRAPLRAIDGYSRILEQDYSSVLDDEGLRLLSIVRKSTRNMDEMITDLLSLSRVGRSELKFERLKMNELVTSTFHELITPENENKINLIINDLPDSFGDPALIRQVWKNLIANAIKYSMPNEKPEIEISGYSKNNINTYTIKDNGVGFNPKVKDKLFGLFQRLHKAGEFEGTGVGLAIVKRIIRRHGGQVWGDSQPGMGAEFSFTLPRKRKIDE